MSRVLVLLTILLAACSSNDSSPPSSVGERTPPTTSQRADAVATPDASSAGVAVTPDAAVPSEEVPAGHDFTPVAKQLIAIASCGGGDIPDGFPVERIERHCAAIKKTQADYAKRWVEPARAFFVDLVPKDIPKKVVYPFAGGDLSTALTIYPDADEITTLSLEPAGDPRTLEVLRKTPGALKQSVTKFAVDPTGRPWKPEPTDPATTSEPPGIDPIMKTPTIIKGKVGLDRALATIEYELHFLYVVNFSNTMNMIDAMRGGQLPTQLVFGLSALQVHGYEIVSLRYFKLDTAGAIVYLTDDDVAKAPDPVKGAADFRNRIFANAEVRFRKPGGRTQIYRHLQVDLDDAHLAKDPRALRHLEAKGKIAGLTKAASYLLSWDSFKTIRTYLVDHVVWMVSDATGVPPKFGTPAGFTYETWGAFHSAHIGAGNQIAKDWRDEFSKHETRSLPFRFGYYDGSAARSNHLVVMHR
ncbi:MAG: hypothetical protein H0T79_19220 [Deltaproteobacteria bacterium]|nr:hypothetical protein [Deltaproteobacteria bacterium]